MKKIIKASLILGTSLIIGLTTINAINKDTKEIKYKGDKIEVKKDAYKEITKGENKDLKGTLYIEPKDIIKKEIIKKEPKKEIIKTEPKKESKKIIVQEPKLINQIKNIEDFKNTFSEFDINEYNNNDECYYISLNDGTIITYVINTDMFYVDDNNGNIEEFEDIQDTKNYISELQLINELEYNKKAIEDIENANNINDILKDTNYTIEDYNGYIEYRDELIKENGIYIYNLMNVEENIHNEKESFIHFMQYGN